MYADPKSSMSKIQRVGDPKQKENVIGKSRPQAKEKKKGHVAARCAELIPNDLKSIKGGGKV